MIQLEELKCVRLMSIYQISLKSTLLKIEIQAQ